MSNLANKMVDGFIYRIYRKYCLQGQYTQWTAIHHSSKKEIFTIMDPDVIQRFAFKDNM